MKNWNAEYRRFRKKIENPSEWRSWPKLEKWWESVFPDCNKDIIVREKGVEIFSVLRKDKDFDSVLREGLKTRNQLVKERSLEAEDLGCQSPDAVGPYRNDIVYFKYLKDEDQMPSKDKEWVSVLVDPNKAVIHNSELRTCFQKFYYHSMLTLADYIERLMELRSKNIQLP